MATKNPLNLQLRCQKTLKHHSQDTAEETSGFLYITKKSLISNPTLVLMSMTFNMIGVLNTWSLITLVGWFHCPLFLSNNQQNSRCRYFLVAEAISLIACPFGHENNVVSITQPNHHSNIQIWQRNYCFKHLHLNINDHANWEMLYVSFFYCLPKKTQLVLLKVWHHILWKTTSSSYT